MADDKKPKSATKSSKIVIDEKKGLIFDSEEELYVHFAKEIRQLEQEFLKARKDDDIPREDFPNFDSCLSETLEDPDEIWEDRDTLSDMTLNHFIADFETDDDQFIYHAVAYVGPSGNSFVFLHFPTRYDEVVDVFRRGRKIFEKTPGMAAEIGEDALSAGDELAEGLYEAMLKLRNASDIDEEDFSDYARYREETIEEADEIWRKTDSRGNNIVNFIKEFSLGDEDFYFISVALEEPFSESHYILFSFPTTDKSLVERYRQGENLENEEFVREESH